MKYESEQRIKEDERAYNFKKARDLEIGRWGLTLLSAANGFLGRLCYIKITITYRRINIILIVQDSIYANIFAGYINSGKIEIHLYFHQLMMKC